MINQKNTASSLKISEDVIASVAKVAASEVHGVASMAEAPVNIKTVISPKGASRSIRINMKKDVAEIAVYVCVEQSARIPDVCEEIQKRVKQAVQNMTGLVVSKVNVHVVDVAVSKD